MLLNWNGDPTFGIWLPNNIIRIFAHSYSQLDSEKMQPEEKEENERKKK